MKSTRPYRRQTILIRPAFQQRAALFTGVLAVSGIFIGVGSLLLLPLLVNAFSQRRMLVSGNILDTLMSSFPYLAVAAGLIFTLAVFLGIYYSHRIMGPLHKVESVLKARLQGEHTGPIILRRKDHLQELAIILNQYFEQENARRDGHEKLLNEFEGLLNKKGSEDTEPVIILEKDRRVFLEAIASIKEMNRTSPQPAE